MTPLLEVQSLVRDFGPHRAVDDVSFTVAPGEVVGLLGPNGAGKTTTLRVIAGLLSPTSGAARVAGVDVGSSPLQARRALGFLTASTGLYERLTGRETLTIFGRLQGLAERELTARIDALVADLELGDFIDVRCGVLSSGQKQRISIARAVVHDPQAYVLDEPTSTLDPHAAADILGLVERARDRGRAVLFSTHRMEEAEHLCTRMLFLRKGKVVAEGTPADLRERSGKPTLTGAFLHYAAGAA